MSDFRCVNFRNDAEHEAESDRPDPGLHVGGARHGRRGAAAKSQTGTDPITLADPFLGTASGGPDFGTGGGAGNTDPGATLPFGLVQFGPDRFPDRDTLGGGYAYRDRVIRGFSVDHISGAGCAAEQDFPVTAVTGTMAASPAVAGSARLRPRFESRFDHAHEAAAPGRYAVTLNPGGPRAINAALTAMTRTADARFAFPQRANATVLVNAGGSAMGDTQAAVALDPSRREITGSAQSGWFCYQPGRHHVYFAAHFSRPFRASVPGAGSACCPAHAAPLTGCRPELRRRPRSPWTARRPRSALPRPVLQAGAYASFAPGPAVTVEIGVSHFSVAGARANLAAEAAGRSFDSLRTRATRRWRSWLDRVRVSGGPRREQRLFATQLYHALLMPNTLSDVTGRYPGMDGRVHRTHATEYANYSGWDIYRSQFPLLTMLAPRTASAMAARCSTRAPNRPGSCPSGLS